MALERVLLRPHSVPHPTGPDRPLSRLLACPGWETGANGRNGTAMT